MKCMNCGFDIGDFPFCPKCGTKAEEIEVPKTELSGESMSLDDSMENSVTPPKQEERKGIPKFYYVTGGALVLLILLALISTFRSTKNTSTSSNSSSNASSNNSSTYSSSNNSGYSYSYSSGYTDAELESLACSALYDVLMNSKSKQGVPLKNWYNIDATRYSIGSIKGDSSSGWTVKGTFSLYNDYGEYRKSGTFSARISSSGYATCSIEID